MSEKCSCCGRKDGWGHTVSDGYICSKCCKIYEATGRTIKKKLTVDEVSTVIREEGDPFDGKNFIFELVDTVFSGTVSSKKKSLRMALILLILAAVAIPYFSRDMIKYLRDGARVEFHLTDTKEKKIGKDLYEVTKIYEGEKDGQTIRYVHTVKEDRSFGASKKREDVGIDSMSLDGKIKVYRENGEWHLAKDAQLKDFLLLMFFPVIMIILGIYFIRCHFHIRKLEKEGRYVDGKIIRKKASE